MQTGFQKLHLAIFSNVYTILFYMDGKLNTTLNVNPNIRPIIFFEFFSENFPQFQKLPENEL